MTEYPPTRTHFSPAELMTALREAYREQLGHPASQRTICVLAAQIALETNGAMACIQWNLGNFRASAGEDFCRFMTEEYEGTPPRAVAQMGAFAVFRSLEEGAERYLHALYTRWTLAWSAAVAGDPAGFARGLHDQKPYAYYTAPVEQYVAGVERWFARYMALPWTPDEVLPEVPIPAVSVAPDLTVDEPEPA